MIPLADIHNHALCGLDDGAPDMHTTLRMLELSYREGVRFLCLTPHYNPALFPKATVARARGYFAQLTEIAAREFPNLQLYLGNEYFAHVSPAVAFREGLCLPLGEGKTVLVEFYPDTPFSQIRDTVLALRAAGRKVLLAHAERYTCLRRDPLTTVGELVSARAYIQVNAASVTSPPLFGTGRFVRTLFRHSYIHVVASDAHDLSLRPPHLRAAYQKVCSSFGEECANAVFWKIPRQLVAPNK